MKCLQIPLRLAMVTTAVFLSLPAVASDHFDGPSVLSDPSSDINDMYVFKSPEDSSRLVLVLNCLPNAGPSAWFSDALEYRFRLRPVSIEGTGKKAGFNVNEQEIVFSCTFGDLRKTTKGDVQRGKLMTSKGDFSLTVNQPTDEFDTTGIRAFAGLRFDPFFMDVPGMVRSFANGKLDFGGFEMPKMNTLSIIVELDSKRFLPNPRGMYGVVGEIRTRGKHPVVLDTFGRAETNNVILFPKQFDTVNQDIEIRDLYNKYDPFGDPGAYGSAFRQRFHANLHRMDKLDGTIDWPLQDGIHPLTELFLPDFTVIDLSKSVGIGSWLEIERSIVLGRNHRTGGGRWLDDDICDIQYTFVIAKDRKQIGDKIDKPNKPAAKAFPYLHEPISGPAPELSLE